MLLPVRIPFLHIALAAAVAAFLAPASSAAQAVQGQVVDARSGQPVPGAVVVLLDANGTRHAAVLSDAAGRYRVTAPSAGSWRLRAERVGYVSTSSPPLELRAGEVVEHRLAADAGRIVLPTVVAQGRGRDCSVRPRDGAETARAWEEARKALQAATLLPGDGRYAFGLQLYRRDLRLEDLAVVREDVWTAGSLGAQPFAAAPAARLNQAGFVVQDRDSLVFHAPDARTLLSDDFLDQHCFSLRDGVGDRAELVGLEFAPVRGRTLPDVHGILWMDRATAALRYLEFVYTGLEWSGDVQQLGGRVDFEQMPEGGWIVRRWYVRMPRLILRASRLTAAPQMTGLVEGGGEVVAMGAGRRADAGTPLSGVVRDSLTGAPVAGARVVLEGTASVAETDSAGRYRLEVPAGAAWLRLSHPSLDSLDLVAPRILLAGAEGARVLDLVLPRPEHLLARACAGTGGVALGGRARAVGRRVQLADARVQARWRSAEGDEVRADVVADGRGAYVLCGLPPGAEVSLAVRAQEYRGRAAVRLPASGAALGDVPVPVAGWTARQAPPNPFGEAGTQARVEGRVLDARGRPLAGAVVRLGADLPARTTGRDGRFSWEDLRAGSYQARVEAPGLAPRTLPLALARGTALQVEVRMR